MVVRHLLVVGASLAGLRAVQAARDAGFDGAVTLVGDEEYLPYDRTHLSKGFLTAADEPLVATFHERAHYTDELGVDLLLGTPATGLDTRARTVSVGGRQLGFDALVIATGARARRLPAADRLGGVHTLRTASDAHVLRRALHAAENVVVIGAGFVGSEVASSARALGRRVTVVDADPAPLSAAIGKRMGALCSELHPANGTDLRCGVGVAGLAGTDRVERVVLDDGTGIPADLVVVGIGATPATGWLAGSGLTLTDGVLCDETLATGTPGVYAAGDLARWRHPTLGRQLRVEHWTTAAEQGLVAGRNAVDPTAREVCTAIPYFWSDWYGNRIQCVGVPDGDPAEIVGDPESGRFVALYRDADRLVGVLAMNHRGAFARYRAQLRGQLEGSTP